MPINCTAQTFLIFTLLIEILNVCVDLQFENVSLVLLIFMVKHTIGLLNSLFICLHEISLTLLK